MRRSPERSESVGIRKRRTKFKEIKTKTMEIKAADVMKLRKMTGAGMMDCKKALAEAEGDFARAQDIIRERVSWSLPSVPIVRPPKVSS